MKKVKKVLRKVLRGVVRFAVQRKKALWGIASFGSLIIGILVAYKHISPWAMAYPVVLLIGLGWMWLKAEGKWLQAEPLSRNDAGILFAGRICSIELLIGLLVVGAVKYGWPFVIIAGLALVIVAIVASILWPRSQRPTYYWATETEPPPEEPAACSGGGCSYCGS